MAADDARMGIHVDGDVVSSAVGIKAHARSPCGRRVHGRTQLGGEVDPGVYVATGTVRCVWLRLDVSASEGLGAHSSHNYAAERQPKVSRNLGSAGCPDQAGYAKDSGGAEDPRHPAC